MRKWGLRILLGLWGLPQAIVGAAVAMVYRSCPYTTFRLSRVVTWNLDSGLSLGLFVFVPKSSPRGLLVHEYGHSVQSIILGPLYLPLVVVPSLLWAGIPWFEAWRRAHDVSYYEFLPERWANRLGERVCKEPAIS